MQLIAFVDTQKNMKITGFLFFTQYNPVILWIPISFMYYFLQNIHKTVDRKYTVRNFPRKLTVNFTEFISQKLSTKKC